MDVNNIKAQVKAKLGQLRSKLNSVPILQKAEDKVKIPKEYLVLVGGSLLFFLFFFGIGAGSICSIVGFIYPAFKSFEAIESKNRSSDVQWLVYWVIYAFFSVIEVFIDFLLYWIPFYYAFKFAFLLWAMLPSTRGAKYLYDSFLKPFLKKNESKIDAVLNKSKKTSAKAAQKMTKVVAEAKED
mmetsp:Transcript_100/g.184  ORF Transcript_100/g.184 Transcript_100/m.184 type:complete len:184 (+) Transcript_100:54-605(+)|eukprot:CAMPEP_0196801090 /NCGR_PEP_ID=MMETSP1362-20130617/736_1 /TAXON_ID=163516 /ORGANISM="Leptocylindrus danicus, Strain CCMP1856" /LENGTH=183 /DNA_ID=CAMNT_0042171811 /DNA_START=54 /DNA_END=605 /DNA_ORIENTATION=+